MMKSLIPWKEYNFMMCQRIGFPPISTIGFGLTWVSSLNLEPKPPARITAFMKKLASWETRLWRRNEVFPSDGGSKWETNFAGRYVPAEGEFGKRLNYSILFTFSRLEGF